MKPQARWQPGERCRFCCQRVCWPLQGSPLSKCITSFDRRQRRLESSAVPHNRQRANGHISAGNGCASYFRVRFEGDLLFKINETSKKKKSKKNPQNLTNLYNIFIDRNSTFTKPAHVCVLRELDLGSCFKCGVRGREEKGGLGFTERHFPPCLILTVTGSHLIPAYGEGAALLKLLKRKCLVQSHTVC